MAQSTSSAQASVDASVSALVASATSGAVSATDPNWQQAYQGKIDELTKSNGQLESQVSQLTQDVAPQLKALLTSCGLAAQAASPAAVATPSEAQSAEPAANEEGFWSQLVYTIESGSHAGASSCWHWRCQPLADGTQQARPGSS